MAVHRGPHWLEREDVEGVPVVRVLAARLVEEDLCHEVFGLLHALVSEAGKARLVLDLDRVEMVDTNAISKLLLLNRETQARGGGLALCGVKGSTAEVLNKMRLADRFAVYGGVQEAVDSFPQADLRTGLGPADE
jgi:anti-anti-sigma regulatory factor